MEKTRFASVAAGLALVAGVLVGCTPTETIAPGAPTFATEEEAFAAAEAVYRTYTEATNSVRAGDASADPFVYVVGNAYELDLRAAQDVIDLGVRLKGHAEVIRLVPQSADLVNSPQTMVAVMCMDWSGVRVIDADGVDITPPTRADIAGLLVSFVAMPEGVRISNSQLPKDFHC